MRTYWVDDSGRRKKFTSMTTLHLYHSAKMIWNNLLSPNNRFGEHVPRILSPRKPRFWLESYVALVNNLTLRTDKTLEMDEFLNHTTNEPLRNHP